MTLAPNYRLNVAELQALLEALKLAPHLGDANERWVETARQKLLLQLQLLGEGA